MLELHDLQVAYGAGPALWGVWWFGEAVPARAGLSALLVLLATLLSLRARPAPAASDP